VTGQPTECSRQFSAELLRQFTSVLAGGTEKVLPLPAALQRFVEPEMSLYIGRLANAAAAELIRRYRDHGPSWTVIGGCRNYTSAMVHLGMVRRIIGNAFGELYPKPGPNYAFQRAAQAGVVAVESWSELTLIQRLMAAAQGLGFTVSGAEVEEGGLSESAGSVAAIPDPFSPGRKVAALRALAPDLAIVHGWVADRFGNVIMGQPNLSDQDIWGALAAVRGVIVTVEKIVDEAFTRERSCLVDLPGFRVAAVCEVPYGAHPQAMSLWGLGPMPGLESYDADFKFISTYRTACKKNETLAPWLADWVFGCPDHAARIAKAAGRFGPVPGFDGPEGWRGKIKACLQADTLTAAPATEEEFMLVGAARKIQQIITEKRCLLMLAGIGHGGLAAYLAYYRTRAAGTEVRLVVGLGVFGYAPRPGSPHTTTLENVATAEMLTGTLKGYGVFVGGANNRCLSILGAGQIDRHGNINSTKTKTGAILFGSGGAIDAVAAEEVLVITRQSPDRLVDQVGFVTCPGNRVRTLVTNGGIFEKEEGGGEFVLTGYFPGEGLGSDEEAVASIRRACGWALRVSPALSRTAPPTPEELALLRVFDPDGMFLKRE
jgi:acyl CoA:acetate/3-ketoacid CoA transferase alpha subunit